MKKVNLLSQAEMKKVMGGNPLPGGGSGCKVDGDLACSISGGGNAEDQCCEGIVCEMNCTGTGTICNGDGRPC